MKKARGRYHHGALRLAAIEAAAREIDEHGHQGFTLDQVARRLGVTPPALYRHFQNRDALLRAVIADAFAQFARRLDAAAASTAEPKPRCAAAFDEYVAFALDNPGAFRLMFSRAGSALFPADQFGIQLAYPELLREALRELMGPRADVDRAFLMMWSYVHGVASLHVEHVLSHLRTDKQRRDHAHELVVTYLDTLGGAGRLPTPRRRREAPT